ncbi:hypothetical protein [Novosphingobium sp.]|uniref:hypothetical protein n=1 Tax=Novosphingobium sp. TaxID=1874826 RepID=UPI0035B3F500
MRLLALATAALLALPGQAWAKNGEIVVNQQAAGTLDAQGFAHAVTVSGGLNVDMPCKFTEMSFAGASMENGKTPYAKDATIVMCADAANSSKTIILIRAAYDTGAAGADAYFESQFADEAKLGAAERTTFKGKRAFKANSSKDGRCRWKMAVRQGDELISLTYIAPASNCDTLKPEATRFLNSLEITK